MKTTSITIRLNNGEIPEGIEAVKAFCEMIMPKQDVIKPEQNAIADAMLKTWTSGAELQHEPR